MAVRRLLWLSGVDANCPLLEEDPTTVVVVISSPLLWDERMVVFVVEVVGCVLVVVVRVVVAVDVMIISDEDAEELFDLCLFFWLADRVLRCCLSAICRP